MHYLFFDESYPSQEKRTVVMAAWAVEQARLTRASGSFAELFRPPVLKRIESLFESLDAWAVISTATLEPDVLRFREIDGTSDVPEMSRTDNVWSQCAIFTVGAVLSCLFGVGQEVGTVDVHFDPKDLKPAHLNATETTLRQLLPKIARECASERHSTLFKKFKIRRFVPVPKTKHSDCGDKFQVGTWIADKLCRSPNNDSQARRSRIMRLDTSGVVLRTIQQWDGIDFYAKREGNDGYVRPR